MEQAQQKSLPQTVVRLTGEIYQKAKAEKNSPQMLKAYIWQMKFREEITPDSFYVSLNGLEQWAVTTDKPLDRAILHSLIGSMYADYASQNRWKLNQRDNVAADTLGGRGVYAGFIDICRSRMGADGRKRCAAGDGVAQERATRESVGHDWFAFVKTGIKPK